MDLSDNLSPNMIDEAPLDTSTLVVACISAATVLVLAAVTCVCCDRTGNDRSSSLSDSRRDTVPLEDLLSKPSLADPESVFSEAGSYDYPRAAPRAGSWIRVSDEASSNVRESLSLSGLNVDEKDFNNFHVVHELNNVSDAQASSTKFKQENRQNYKLVNSKLAPALPPHKTQTPVECARVGYELTTEFGRSITVSGSPKKYKHQNISGKVGLDSTSLQIHRDSVTRVSAPFLSSTRCSFSHEVGHIVHGNKVPRTSLPKTEETDDERIKSLPGFNINEEHGHEVAGLSFEVQTEHTRTSSLETVVANSCQQSNGSMKSACDNMADKSEHKNCIPISQTGNALQQSTVEFASSEGHAISATNTPLCRSNSNNNTNTSHLTEDPDEYQHTSVPMRRCLSCVHGNQVCVEQPAKSRRKTFSLNLQIDVHFDSLEGYHQNLSTIVCSPLTEYNQYHKHTTSEKCDRHVTADIVTKHIPSRSVTNANQISNINDENAKERLLQRSFELKYNNFESSDLVGKRRSEPTILEYNGLKNCNARRGGRFSETESANMAASEIFNDQNHPGPGLAQRVDISFNGVNSDSKVPRTEQNARFKHHKLPSSSFSCPIPSELSHTTAEIAANGKQDTGCLNVEPDMQTEKSHNNTRVQRSVNDICRKT